MRTVVGSYDPDDEEAQFGKRPAWQKSKTALQEKALSSCGRTYFKSREERKRWNALEEKSRGANDEDILLLEWIIWNAELCQKINGNIITRSFTTLLAMIENETRQLDWKIANQERVFKDRKLNIEALFEKGRTEKQ